MDAMSVVKQIGQNTKIRSKLNVDKNISSSSFDKTYVGRVVGKNIYNLNRQGNTGSVKENEHIVSEWLVFAGGQNFKIDVNNCDITYVGEEVRVFVPNNNKLNVYAEAISPSTAPDKSIYQVNDENYVDYKSYGVDEERKIKLTDITINTLTQYWILADGTYLKKVYILTVINVGKEDEEVTNVIHPDGKKEVLEGFFIGKGQGKEKQVPDKVKKISNNEVKAYYDDENIIITKTANGADNERHEFETTIEVLKEGQYKTVEENDSSVQNKTFISEEEATAIMMSGGETITPNTSHPIKLEYKDQDPNYELPESITLQDNETFDTITETWRIDPSKEREFDSEDNYSVGDIVVYNSKIYQCTKEHIGIWDESDFTEIPDQNTIIWGVGVKNKGTDDEEVTRLIYPDFSQVELINFNGVSGLG